MKNRSILYFLTFICGFIVCALVLKGLYGIPGTPSPQIVGKAAGYGVKFTGNGNNQVRIAAKAISDYVVNIDTIGKPVSTFPLGDIFGMPFGRGEMQIPKGQASGVIFSSDGYILTNNHVVSGTTELSVTLHNGKKYSAKLIGRDSRSDIAVVKIDVKNLDYAKFADSDTLDVGDWVIAVGNALGLGPTVTLGIVSAKRDEFDINGKVFEAIIQTDASINRGNSGGALADLNGNLVGINTAIASTGPDGGSIGIGFAVPSNTVKKIADQLIKYKEVQRPWLGIGMMSYNVDTRKMFEQQGASNLYKGDGVLINNVFDGSSAAIAGIQPGDIILKLNGKLVSPSLKTDGNKVGISKEIQKLKVGNSITLEIWKAKSRRIAKVSVILGKMPADIDEQQMEP